ncbi:MAG: cytochrome b/b6 domain-containing protein [Sphingobacteriales bacterium]|nr:cytochrome b/b6 domain-containing protein [Sphingobacteriales bacterium]
MQQALFHERYSWSLRIWHWLTFIIVAALIATVLVSDTFLDGQHTRFIVSTATERKGAVLTPDQTKEVVITLRQTIWKWHTYLGYVLGGLFAFRLLLEFFQTKEERFVRKFKKGFAASKQAADKKEGKHYFIVKIIYALFYILLTTIVITGLLMAFYDDDPAMSKETFHDIKEIHEKCYYILLVFLLIHLGGVIKAEFGKDKNIISRMVHGRKE